MMTKTINTTSKSKFLALFVLFFGLCTINGFAQSEQDQNRVELPAEAPTVDDLDLTRGNNGNIQQKNPKTKPSLKAVVPQSTINKTVVDPLAENKEVKKEESASTLSFNFFLYIVDKFRAD